MAVRHGYGKIAGADALVFAYDTGDTRNSYRGEPTVNTLDGGANRADGITGVFQHGNHAGADSSQYVNEYYSAKRPHVLKVKTTNATGYGMINQRMTSAATVGTTYTYSFDYKQIQYGGTFVPSLNVYGDGYKVPDSSNYFANLVTRIVDLDDGWKRFEATYDATYAGRNTFRTNMQTGDTTNFEILFDNFQIEQKSHATPFVNGTRSATQGLLDLTGNKTITLDNTTYDSNAEIDLDGSNASFQFSTAYEVYDADYSVEAVFKRDVSGVSHGIITDYQYGWWRLKVTSANTLYWNHKLNDSNINSLYSNQTIGTAWTHVMITFSKTDGAKMYINGVLDNSNTDTRAFGLSSSRGPRYVGQSRNGAPSSPSEYFNGKIPVVKIYTRTLTPTEVAQNFGHYKSRFGI